MSRHRKLTRKFAGFPMFKLATSGDTFPVTSPFTTGFTGLETDQLALDLQFATDKTLTARKGPTPTFTRASSATFVGSNGLIQSAGNNVARFDHDPVTLACKGLLIEESRTNAALYSGAIVVGTGWGGTEVTSSVDGAGPDGNNAYQVTETTATSIHSFSNSGGSGSTGATSVVSGTTYTGSIFFKKVAGSVDWIQLTFAGATFGTAQYANFNISNGTIGNSSGTTPRIENYGNGWYRCSISAAATANSSTTLNLVTAFLNNANGTTRLPSYAGSTANKFLAAMAQFETGTFPTSYIPTTTASVIRSADVCSISSISSFYQGLGTILVGSRLNGLSGLNGLCGFNSGGALQISVNRLANNTRASTNGAAPAVSLNSGSLAFSVFVKSAFAFNTNDAAFANNGVIAGTSTSLTLPTVTAFGVGTNGQQPMQSGHISEIKYYKKRLSNEKLQTLTV